jgi:hypothetical protein
MPLSRRDLMRMSVLAGAAVALPLERPVRPDRWAPSSWCSPWGN